MKNLATYSSEVYYLPWSPKVDALIESLHTYLIKHGYQIVADDGKHQARYQFDDHGVNPEVDVVEEFVVFPGEVRQAQYVESNDLMFLDYGR